MLLTQSFASSRLCIAGDATRDTNMQNTNHHKADPHTWAALGGSAAEAASCCAIVGWPAGPAGGCCGCGAVPGADPAGAAGLAAAGCVALTLLDCKHAVE